MMGATHRAHACTVASLCGLAVLATTVPAAAVSAAAGVSQGSGTLSPGLGVLPSPQVIQYSGTLTGAGAVAAAPVIISDSCSFSGTSGPLGGTVAADLGTVSGSCTGSVSITATLTFARIGVVVALEGNGSIGPDAAIVGGPCAFAATQAPPITSYSLVCALAGG